MEPKLIAAIICIMSALTFYTIGVFAERKLHLLKKWHVWLVSFMMGMFMGMGG